MESPTKARALEEVPPGGSGCPGPTPFPLPPPPPSSSNWLGFPETGGRQREVGLGGEFFPDVFVVWHFRAGAPSTPTLLNEEGREGRRGQYARARAFGLQQPFYSRGMADMSSWEETLRDEGPRRQASRSGWGIQLTRGQGLGPQSCSMGGAATIKSPNPNYWF